MGNAYSSNNVVRYRWRAMQTSFGAEELTFIIQTVTEVLLQTSSDLAHSLFYNWVPRGVFLSQKKQVCTLQHCYRKHANLRSSALKATPDMNGNTWQQPELDLVTSMKKSLHHNRIIKSFRFERPLRSSINPSLPYCSIMSLSATSSFFLKASSSGDSTTSKESCGNICHPG